MDKINILIVDDEALLREGLRALLEKESFINKIYEASDEEEFNQHLVKQNFDIVLMDIRLRKISGIELLQKIDTQNTKLKIIAVTGLDGIETVINLLKAGIHGFVYKLDGYGEILKAIKAVRLSENYFPESILKIIQANVNRWNDIPTVLLTQPEKDLLKEIASGVTTKEIAVQFKMSETTVQTYRARLMKKLGVSNTAALIAYAFRNGIL